MLMRLKKNEIGKIEGTKVVIVWKGPKKALICSLILDDRIVNVINSMNNMRAVSPQKEVGTLAERRRE